MGNGGSPAGRAAGRPSPPPPLFGTKLAYFGNSRDPFWGHFLPRFGTILGTVSGPVPGPPREQPMARKRLPAAADGSAGAPLAGLENLLRKFLKRIIRLSWKIFLNNLFLYSTFLLLTSNLRSQKSYIQGTIGLILNKTVHRRLLQERYLSLP